MWMLVAVCVADVDVDWQWLIEGLQEVLCCWAYDRIDLLSLQAININREAIYKL